MLTIERLKELLYYDPGTGKFTWKIRRGRCSTGAAAGCTKWRSNTYKQFQICVDGSHYNAGTLAWFYVTGVYPADEVDHEDKNTSNNCWVNLRLATRSQQLANRRGWGRYAKGVAKTKYGFQSQIMVNGKTKYLGTFSSEEEAAIAYEVVAKEVHKEFYSAE